MLRTIFLISCILAAGQLSAQSDSTAFSKLLAAYKIKTSIGLQFWATYAQDMQVYNPGTKAYSAADNRLNTQLRRSRFSISGNPYQGLSFKLTAALDLVGHDVLAATESGGNNGSSPGFRIWNAYLNINLQPKKDLLLLTIGYFVPPIGRESNTSALRSTSFEKAWSQNYLRRQLTGTGPGRATGLMLGGQLHNQAKNLHFTYEAAIQNPVSQAFGGNSTGLNWSPLMSGRVSIHLGDAEHETYRLDHKVNYFGARKGLTLSLVGAYQRATDQFIRNGAYGMETLFNGPGFHLDGEFLLLNRSFTTSEISRAKTGYVRIGKNIQLPKQRILEPVVNYWFFQGPTTLADLTTANNYGYFTGEDYGLDLGVNLYLNPNFKWSLFYALRAGSSGEGNAWETNNNYYQQAGVGAVERGNYLGMGLVVSF